MNIIIASTNGFLGSRLKNHLKKKHKIFNYSIKKKNVLPKQADVIINVCGPTAQDCYKKPKVTRYLRSIINKKLLKISKKLKVKIFLYVSTIHVYHPTKIITEESILNYKDSYSLSHINGEKELLKSPLNKEIDIKILRTANCIGYDENKKSQMWNLLAGNLCKNLILTNKIVLNSKINTYRNFMPVYFFLKSIDFFLSKKNNLKILNISSNQSISILNIAKTIRERFQRKTGIKVKIEKDFKKEGVKNFITSKNKLLTKYFKQNSKKFLNFEIDRILKLGLKYFKKKI